MLPLRGIYGVATNVGHGQSSSAIRQVRYIDPNRRERSKTFRRKVDAERFLVHVESQKQRGDWIDPELSSIELEDWATRWLATRSHLRPKTYAGYESILRVHVLPRFGTLSLDRIKRTDIEEWITEIAAALSPSRTRQVHQVLTAILEAAVDARYLAANPARRIPLPRHAPPEQLFLTAEQVNALAAETPDEYRTLVYVMGPKWRLPPTSESAS